MTEQPRETRPPFAVVVASLAYISTSAPAVRAEQRSTAGARVGWVQEQVGARVRFPVREKGQNPSRLALAATASGCCCCPLPFL